MAVITDSPNEPKPSASRPRRTRPRKESQNGSFLKRHKTAAIVGGAGVAILLVGHSSSGGTASTTMQAQADQLAADQSALDSGLITPASSPALTGDTSASDGSSGDTTDTTGTTDGGAGGGAGLPTTTPPGTAQIGPIYVTETPQPGTQPPDKNGHTKPIATGVDVADPRRKHHHGSGTTVHGRTFPGARHVTTHPSKRHPNGDTHTRVTVNYGGHTSHHVSVNHGQSWIDHPKGVTPPSRSTPVSRSGGAGLTGMPRQRPEQISERRHHKR